MIKTAVFSYGNVGKAAVEACLNAADIELVGIVDPFLAGQKANAINGAGAFTVAADMDALPDFEAAVIGASSRAVPDLAEALLKKGKYTADSYDIHTNILELRARLDAAAKEGGVASVTAAGWDPGTDSVIRALFAAMAPRGITYTNFGPGMSMGHSVAAKAVDGVRDALSMTIPLGTSIHRRMVYVELEEGCSLEEAAAKIKADDYFAHDETHVEQVPCVRDILDVGHGVSIVRKGAAGASHNQLLEYNMRINGPALTGQILVCALRAAVRQRPGCYTFIEIPPVDLLPGSREEAVRSLV